MGKAFPCHYPNMIYLCFMPRHFEEERHIPHKHSHILKIQPKAGQVNVMFFWMVFMCHDYKHENAVKWASQKKYSTYFSIVHVILETYFLRGISTAVMGVEKYVNSFKNML